MPPSIPTTEDLTAALIEANSGEPVDVVLETAGGRVFEHSLQALAPFGRLVAYGNSTREKVRVSNAALLKTSRAVVGFWLYHCLERREMVEPALADLFDRAARGELVPQVGETYPLSEVRRAHEDIAGRRTTGKLLLDPERVIGAYPGGMALREPLRLAAFGIALALPVVRRGGAADRQELGHAQRTPSRSP